MTKIVLENKKKNILSRFKKPKEEIKVSSKNYKSDEHELKDIKKLHSEIEYRRRLENIITRKDYLNPLFWKRAMMNKFFKNVSVIVFMELNNGNMRTFLQIIDKDNSFRFKGKRFVFDTEYRYFNIDLQMYCINYHESLSLPIKRKHSKKHEIIGVPKENHIPVTEIKEAMKDIDSEIESSLDPLTLDNFIRAKVTEGMMRGQNISSFLQKYGFLTIIILIVCVAHLLLFMYKTGMFEQITGSLGL